VSQTTVVDAIVDLIRSVPRIGIVFDHDPWDRNDIRNVLMSQIGGQSVLRAWWVSGPTMGAAQEDASADRVSFGNMPMRTWTYTIHGVEGLAPAYPGDTRGPGGDIVTLRANAVAITDALDEDVLLGGTAPAALPCVWPNQPAHRVFDARVVVSYIQIVKQVITLGTP